MPTRTLPLCGAFMGCLAPADRCRADHVAARLAAPERDGTDWEAKCPSCHHGGFRVSQPSRSHYRHIWACACRRCKCSPADVRSALLAAGVMPGCLGSYGANGSTGTDPAAAARLQQAVDDILAAPGLKPADIRIVLAEARGQKVPGDYGTFVKWAMGIGIGRSQAYEAASRWCRPADSPSPGG